MNKTTQNLMIIAFLLAGSIVACQNTENDNDGVVVDPLVGCMVIEKPQEVILGKWNKIADATYVNQIHERTDGIYWEFFPDGTVHFCIPHSGPNDPNTIVNTATYTIDGDILVCKFEWGTEDHYRYGFFEKGEKLKLVRADWTPFFSPPEGVLITTVYIPNIIIFNQKK